VDVMLVHVCLLLTVQQFNSSPLMSLSPGIMMAGGDGLHGDEAGRKRELRLLKNKSVKTCILCVLVCGLHLFKQKITLIFSISSLSRRCL